MKKVFKKRGLWQLDSLRKGASMYGGELKNNLPGVVWKEQLNVSLDLMWKANQVLMRCLCLLLS